ncbi:hypothetical protein BDQ94DRAFT_136317, partial [Aspergillus welwitschiae]
MKISSLVRSQVTYLVFIAYPSFQLLSLLLPPFPPVIEVILGAPTSLTGCHSCWGRFVTDGRPVRFQSLAFFFL